MGCRRKQAELADVLSLDVEAFLGCATTPEHSQRDVLPSSRLETSCEQGWHACKRF